MIKMLVFLIFVIGIFLRTYNFSSRLIFGPEQGMSFITAASNLEKFSLLGETNFIRATSDSHILFHGAYYSYFLLPFLKIFNFQILPITIIFLILNLVTGLVLYLVTKKFFGKLIATFSLFYFMTSAVMIHHSLFAWIVNPTPLLSILSLYFFPSPLILGVLSGLGFGMQNLYLPFAFLIFILIIYKSKNKFLSVFLFFTGLIIGSLPTVIFDLRHNFYHLRTYWQFFIDTLSGQSPGSTSYYNFLYLFPYLFIVLAYITHYLYKKNKFLTLIPILLFLYLNITSSFFDLKKSTGMPSGLTYQSISTFASSINNDNPPENFNVATLWDFDTRAYPLRFLLKYVYGKSPKGLEDYQNLDTLYVAAPQNYDIKNPNVWELSVHQPYQVSEIPTSISGYKLYKLNK